MHPARGWQLWQDGLVHHLRGHALSSQCRLQCQGGFALQSFCQNPKRVLAERQGVGPRETRRAVERPLELLHRDRLGPFLHDGVWHKKYALVSEPRARPLTSRAFCATHCPTARHRRGCSPRCRRQNSAASRGRACFVSGRRHNTTRRARTTHPATRRSGTIWI